MKDYDVAIIGGGLLGSAFGWGLARRGKRCLLCDEGDNAIRTARGNFGLVWMQGKGLGMPEYAQWTLKATQQWSQFASILQDDTGLDVHYERKGGFSICIDDEELDKQVKLLETLTSEAGDRGYDYEVVKHQQLKEAIPIIGKVAGATYCPHDGHCNPLKLLRALHAGYILREGDYRSNAKITRIEPVESGGFKLYTASGERVAVAEKVIIAAGHGSQVLAEQVGLDMHTYPDQGQLIVTEKTVPRLDFPTNCVRQTDEGNFLLGPSSKDTGLDVTTDTRTLQQIAAQCVAAFPILETLRIQRVWAAIRVLTPDGYPVYQHSNSHSGAFSFACHSGVTLAANHALTVADWIIQGAVPEEYSAFYPERFHVQENT
ncbi:MAG: FAD-binding oxidoreductase [Gammaproteobacteria bacterium]|nr:FAD-binding oxidoreductase [Gammaproteobacteria bacterium]